MAAKFVVASMAFVACTLADPGYYGYAGYTGYGYPGYGNGVARHYGGGSSFVGRTVWGFPRGKRSADAEPEAEAGIYGYGYAPRSYGYGYGLAARAYHPYGATSYEYRSPQGLRGKRSADAEPGYLGYGYGYAPRAYGYNYGYRSGVAAHPTGYSYTHRSPQGLRGKRSAEPFGYRSYGYGYPTAARSYQEVSRPFANSHYRTEDNVYSARVYEDNFNGAAGYRGKRSAEPYYGYAGSFQTVNRPGSSYSVNDRVYAANVQESNANYGAAYGYGFQSGRGYYY